MEDITKMRNSKGRVWMLIVPVILLVAMIFIYREYARNKKDNNEPPITLAPTPTGAGTKDPTPEPSPAASPESTLVPSPTAESSAGVSGNGGI